MWKNSPINPCLFFFFLWSWGCVRVFLPSNTCFKKIISDPPKLLPGLKKTKQPFHLFLCWSILSRKLSSISQFKCKKKKKKKGLKEFCIPLKLKQMLWVSIFLFAPSEVSPCSLKALPCLWRIFFSVPSGNKSFPFSKKLQQCIIEPTQTCGGNYLYLVFGNNTHSS